MTQPASKPPPKVGSTRPTLRSDWMDRSIPWKILAYFERASGYFFYLFNHVAIFRFSVEVTAAIVLIITVVGVMQELQQREIDRPVRIATMFAQIAQTHALPDGKGLTALKKSVEVLARENVPMHDIDLSGANLRKLSLGNADFTGANFSDTDCRHLKLPGATLSHAIFERANFRGANLVDAKVDNARKFTDANFHGATLDRANFHNVDFKNSNFHGATLIDTNLSKVNLQSAKGLTQSQVDKACSTANMPPKLPGNLTWKNRVCPSQGFFQTLISWISS